MSKIIINSKVISNDVNERLNKVKAILKDDEIIYNNNGINVEIIFFKDKIILKRENKDMKLILELQEGKTLISFYFIKDLNTKIKIKTKTKSLKRKDNSIKIEYDLFMNDEFSDSFTYNLEWSDLK